MNRHFVSITASVFLAAMLLCVPHASAQPAGYDLLKTTTGASIDLTPRPGFPGIPGLAPLRIPLEGVPICACTGAADTIMHRDKKLPSGTAALTVVALFLKNSERVSLGGRPVDVYITINNKLTTAGIIGQDTVPQPDTLAPSTGTLTIRSDGTFDSAFVVNADVIVVAAGADVRNPATTVLAHHRAPAVHLGAPGSTWSATPPPDYPKCFFPGNGFYPGGPVPETDPTNAFHRHPVAPSTPVTATLTVTPTTYSGHCPTHFHFDGTINAPAGMHGTYTLLYSDGGTVPTYTFDGPGPVHIPAERQDWLLGLPGSYWVAIKILTPGVVESNHATFTLACTP